MTAEFVRRIGDPVLVLDPSAAIVGANNAGKQLLERSRQAWSHALADRAAAIQEAVEVPLQFELGEPLAGTRIAVFRARSYSLVLVDVRASAAQDLANRPNAIALVADELVEPLALLVNAGRRLLGDLHDGLPNSPEADDAEAALRRLRGTLGEFERLQDLLAVRRRTSFSAVERLTPDDLAAALEQRVHERCKHRRLAFKVQQAEADLPPVYGAREWLQEALGVLLDELLRAAPPRSRVVAELHRVAGFLYLKVLEPQCADEELGRDAARAPQPAPLELPLELSAKLAHWVIEHHGGSVFRNPDQGVPLVVQLPAAAPRNGVTEDTNAQLERFAAELEQLMALQNPAPAPA